VVSKEEVAAGMGVDQPECGAGRGQPRKMVEYEHSGTKSSENVDRCGLWVAIWWC
jgi:hypothetical protein